MKRSSIVLVLALAACADASVDTSDTTAPDADDEGGSAVIVTTTTAPPASSAPPPTGAPDTDATQPSAPTSSEPADSTTTPTITTPTATTPTTTTTTVPVVGEPDVVADVVVDGLDLPVDLAVRPGDDALYIVEQTGRIVQVTPNSTRDVADISDRTEASSERGLLGLAFSPDGRTAYLNYTDSDQNTVIAEYPVTEAGDIDVRAERTLLVVDQPYGNHNAGDLAIGPDGMLWIPLGDGGSGGDPERRANDPRSLIGSLLRIDPSAPDGERPYGIPSDNPFADGAAAGTGGGAPEVWAWGLRNPWKIAFDPITDELWIADVGQNEFEEVNVVGPTAGLPAGRGADFGWSAFEGFERFNTDIADPGDTIAPVLTYRHGDDGCSISGGVPYRGTAIAELAPAYVYSDFCSGWLWALDLAGNRNLTLLTGFRSVTAVRTGPDGELYVIEHGGTVYRLVDAL